LRVLRISASDTYPIRHQILRPGRPIESCHFQGDEDDQTFHLGAFVESKLVSVASFFFEKHPALDAPYQYRLRGMATLPEHRFNGLSSELLKMGFPIVKQNFCQLVWCNARLEAKGFYEKVGFVPTGEIFDVPEIGQHILMFKKLD
jgi:predicted GNAT family N-acyltransferase